MYRSPFYRAAVLFVLILAMIMGIHLLARADGGNTIYLPVVHRTFSCDVPSSGSGYQTIQSAVDGGCEIIHLTVSLYTENIIIDGHSVTIKGQGPDVTAINGNANGSVFQVEAGSELWLEDLTVTNGSADRGGGILNWGVTYLSNSVISGNSSHSPPGGGGIYNGGTLQIFDSQIIGNSAGSLGSCGGGIMNDAGDLLIEGVEIVGNVAGGLGGGICNTGFNSVIDVKNSLIANNNTKTSGGGVYSGSCDLSVIENSTISGNFAAYLAGGISACNLELVNVTISQNDSSLLGGSVVSTGEIRMVNSILTDDPPGSICAADGSGEFTSLGHNIADDDSCNLNGPGDMPNTAPLLGPLQDNGGPTRTNALLPGSPAIDTADNAACPATDQRGVIRPQGAGCDVGAYEYDG